MYKLSGRYMYSLIQAMCSVIPQKTKILKRNILSTNDRILVSFFVLFFVCFWLHLQHIWIPKLRTETAPQQQPKPLQWQCPILNHRRTLRILSFFFSLQSFSSLISKYQNRLLHLTQEHFMVFCYWQWKWDSLQFNCRVPWKAC